MEPTYKVVWPLGPSTLTATVLKPRPNDLNNITVGEISHGGFRDPEIRPIVEETLKKRFPGIKFVDKDVFGSIRGDNEDEVIASLPARLREHGCDVAIVGIGS